MGAFTARDAAWPLVSVVMPCYNAAPYLAEAVSSVLAQSYRHVELLVVDDGSTDGSVDIVRALARQCQGLLEVCSTARLGPYPARNAALRRARGDLIAFLDADDWWQPEALAKLHRALVDHEADIAYCGWQNVGEEVASAPYVPPAYEEGDAVDAFLRTCPWPIHAALIRRGLVERLGGFAEHRYSSMDYDLWLRALALGPRLVRVPEVLAFYRWHGARQVSAVKWRQVLDALAAQQRFIRENPALVAHLPEERLREHTEGQVLRQAYRALWKRDLESAQKLFRHVAARGSFRLRDLGHVLAALLPTPVYGRVVALSERRPG